MNRRVSSSLIILTALCTTACMPPWGHSGEHAEQSQAAPASTTIASDSNRNCDAQANKKLSMFDRPDTYPISENEKHNAYQALYNECMKAYDPQVAAGPKPGFDVAAANTNFAGLSPAAGGPMPARTGGVTVANGVTVIDTAQFANLSPAAGGGALAGTGITGISSGISGNGSTVVVVQAAPSTTTLAPVVMPPVPTHAAAIPVTPAAKPKQLVDDASDAPKEKPKKVARAKSHSASQTAAAKENPADKRSRFAKNAVPVTNLNSLQPSAGSLVDSSITTNLPPQKY